MIRRSWMIGASIETTRELWASSLREVKKRIRPLFAQERAALNAGLFVDGLLGDERRKTGWMRAEAAGDPGPWRQQAVLGRDRWDADALRDLVRDYATEHLADENAVLVIDETCDRSQSCWRQRNNWLVWIPAPRATSEATAPGSMAAATIRSFHARDPLRRRCNDVITSTTCVVDI